MEDLILIAYFIALLILFTFGSHGFIMIYYYFKYRDTKNSSNLSLTEFPAVTIQLPIYNEIYVVKRIIQSTCEIEYPKEKLEIQILDDSTDETSQVVVELVEEKSRDGFDIKQIRRGNREGFQSGRTPRRVENRPRRICCDLRCGLCSEERFPHEYHTTFLQ